MKPKDFDRCGNRPAERSCNDAKCHHSAKIPNLGPPSSNIRLGLQLLERERETEGRAIPLYNPTPNLNRSD